MDYTQNLHLPQWEADDRIMRTDFNDAMASIDAAVKNNADALAALQSAAAGFGDCQIETRTYTGNGGYGQSGTRSLTFDHEPYLLFFSGFGALMIVFRNATSGHVIGQTGGCTLTWNGKTISWYGYNSGSGMNCSDTAYTVIALCKK